MTTVPPVITLDVVCGQPLTVTLPVYTAADTPINTALLASARAQVRPSWDSPQVLHEWTTVGGSPNASIVSGGITLRATAAQTVDWQVMWPTSATWDLLVVDTTGVTHRLTSAGPVRLYPAVTR